MLRFVEGVRTEFKKTAVDGILSFLTILPIRKVKYSRGSSDTKLSAGMFGIALALNLCGEVHIYGFTGTSSHYYPKVFTSRHTPLFNFNQP